jgi:hypothetical protein
MCVAFIGIEYDDGRFIPKATGFFADALEGDQPLSHLVTAEHVIAHIKSKIADDERGGTNARLSARLNVRRAGSEIAPLEEAHWWSHPDEANLTDVAVTPYLLQHKHFDHFSLPLYGTLVEASATEHLQRRGAALGQEIAIVGLFRHHGGTERNEPIIRIGNIAAMPKEKVWTSYCGRTAGYLVEARSIGGLSGSPVFVNLTDSPPRSMNVGGGRVQYGEGIIDFSRYMLFGLMHGHWDLPNLTDESVVEDAHDKRERLNTGVGVVIPVQKIIETLYHPELVDIRKNYIRTGWPP